MFAGTVQYLLTESTTALDDQKLRTEWIVNRSPTRPLRPDDRQAAANPTDQEELRMSAGVLGAIIAVVAGALFVAVFRSKGKPKQ